MLHRVNEQVDNNVTLNNRDAQMMRHHLYDVKHSCVALVIFRSL
jgi:hypothetical protein